MMIKVFSDEGSLLFTYDETKQINRFYKTQPDAPRLYLHAALEEAAHWALMDPVEDS